jgi:hypothetical protein
VPERSEGPAFYALAPGGWRDYWTLLHPPYTLWHLSYVAIGASLASEVNGRWLGESLVAFFLGMGLAAHAMDELHGRPLSTRIPDGMLWTIAIVGLGGAVALGIDGVIEVSPWLSIFIAFGGFIVVAYNLELFGGWFHSDLWFALAWGAFPALTGFFAQTGRVTVSSIVVAGACAALSAAQRTLSTPVRRLRRHVTSVSGELTLADGTAEAFDASALRRTPETALRYLSLAMVLLGVGLVIARFA